MVLGPTTDNGWWIPSHRPAVTYPYLMICLLIPTAHGSSAPLTDQTKAEWLSSTWDLLPSKNGYSQLIQCLKDPEPCLTKQTVISNIHTSSCSHKGQLSHISCGFLACLSTVAKFQACYHSPADTWRYMEPQEK